MAFDTQAMGLLIRMMPLVQREFSLRIEPTTFFDDSGYRTAIIDSALQSAEPRLVDYTHKLCARLAELSAGPPGALRSSTPATGAAAPAAPPAGAAAAPAAEPPPPAPTDAPRKYVGRLR
jgi:hypothetical protein